MIVILHERMAQTNQLNFQQLMLSTLIAIRHTDDTYTILKNRFDGTTPERINRAEMLQIVARNLL